MTKINNAVRYIVSSPYQVMLNIYNTTNVCPIHAVTGMGMSTRCRGRKCKKHMKEWLKKKEEC